MIETNEYQTQSKHKYCRTCGKPIHPQAEICPQCGVRQELPPVQSPGNQVVNVRVNQESQKPQAILVKRWNRFIACCLSVPIPGLGQLYKGQWVAGFGWFFGTCFAYVFGVALAAQSPENPGAALGLLVHMGCIINAGMGDPYKVVK